MLIPNRNYYEIFEKKDIYSVPEFVRSNGVYTLFSGICKNLGIEKLLKQLFPEDWEKILTVAQYMLSEGNVMYYLPDWQDETVCYAKEQLTDQSVSGLFSRIDEEGRLLFFRNWMKEKYKGEYLAYDVTSIFSYSKKIESLEWGYNRDKEAFRRSIWQCITGMRANCPLLPCLPRKHNG